MGSNTARESIKSLTIISVIAIVAMAIICLASLGYNSKILMEKGKIEVTTTYSNLEQNNIDM